MIEISCATTLSAVGTGEWNALTSGNSFYLTHQWLAAQDLGQSVAPQYFLARRQGRLVGALPTYVVEREGHEAYQPGRLVDGRWTGRYVIAGGRRAYANDVLVAADLPDEHRNTVVRALVDAAVARADEAGMDGVLFLYLGTAGAEAVTTAYPAARPLLTSAEAVIELPGTSFEDYLDGFAPQRRREFAREMARFEAAGYTLATGRAQEHWEELVSLFANLQERYGHGGGPEQWRPVVERQAARLDDYALILLCRQGDSAAGPVVGSVLSYPWSGTLYQKLVGFDYSKLSGAFEYFNLVYYFPIRFAYENDIRTLHLGREAFEAKLRRGAGLRPLWSIEIGRGADAGHHASAWNPSESRRWRARYAWSKRAFDDDGWRRWGCEPGD